MRARSFIWLLLGLLLLAGGLYFWQAKSALLTATSRVTAVATAAPVRLRPAATNYSVIPAGNAPAFLTSQSASAPSAPKRDPLAFRLSNTPKTSGQLLRDDHAILLENALIDTRSPLGFSIPQHLRAAAEPGSYIVQAHGPVNAAFRNALTAAGGTIISYIPNNAYLVRLSAEGAGRMFAGGLAQSVLPYEPVYKLKAELLQLAMEQQSLPADAKLNVMILADLRAPTLREFQQAGAVVLGESSSPFGPVITIQPGENWTALAQLPGVAVVERVYPRVAANDLTRVLTGVASDSVVSSNYLNLTGEGVLVNVNDTGVDPAHPDLTGRVIADFASGLVDDNGHGTFVAGEIAGDGTVSATVSNAAGSLNPGVEGQYRGKAPLARIFAQSLDLSFGPASDGYLQTSAARTNAFISNNSWHYGNNNTYGMASASYDAAVRDALPGVTGSQPVLFVFAAGNAGDGADTGIGGDPGSIFAPGTAKNVLTVGATELPRDITNAVVINCTTTNIDGTNVISCETNYPWQGLTSSANEVAAFSSRGNVGRGIEGDFGRFKPDVVAPGTFVVSTRSTTWDEKAYYNPTSHFVVAYEGQFIQTNSFYYGDIFLPNNAVGFSLRLLNMTNLVSGAQVLDLPIFVKKDDYPVLEPPTYDFVRTNFVSVPPDGGGVGANVGQSWYYGVLNTTTQEVIFDIIHDVLITNLYGNRLEVLSNLNNSISGTNAAAPQYYRYESGTSMAAADVSGTLVLMQQFFQDRQITNSPALMKALLINGARSAGSTYNFQVQNSINYQGWGLINLPNSLHGTLTNGINTPATNSMLLFDQSPATALATGQSQTWKISVSDAGRALPLRVTLVWTDPPGNPAAGVKLVNDLDLVVTNLDGPLNPIVYYGNDFPGGSDPFTLATDTNAPPKVDAVNNVENVYITPSPLSLGTNYSITVSARRVNVNAVTAQTNNVVQDYALVISSGDGEVATLSLASASPPVAPAVATEVTLVTNLFSAGTFTSGSLIGQRVGANTPLLGTTNGMTNQWHFYIVTNNTTFTNASFLISASTDVSLPRIGAYQSTFLRATRHFADLDLYASQDPGLLQLDPAVIAGADTSRSRNTENGDEAVIYDDSAQGQVYYIGVKSEDQMAGDFEFFAVFSLVPLAQEDADGYVQAYPFTPPQGFIPDGSPDKPGVSKWIAFLAGQGEVRRVIVTNSLLCENIADLVGAVVSPSQKAVVLNNHILPTVPLPPGPYNFVYEDNDEGDVPGAIHPDGPGELRDFVGDAKGGQWKFYYVDNSLSATGRVDNCKIKVERQPGNGESITNTVPPNSWQYYAVNIPAGATNLTVCLELISAVPQPLEIYVRKDEYPTSTAYDYKLTVNPPTGPPPGTCLSISLADLPALSPGRYYVGIFNGSPTSQTYVYTATYYTDPGSVLPIGWNSSGNQPLRDDAVTDSVITVTNEAIIQQVEVGLRIDHPRVSDLAVTLISPRGTRVLLAENRGGTSTEGFGTSISVTNIAPVTSSGGADAVTNVIATGATFGSLTLDYNFFCAPDRMLMLYDGATIFDTGLTNNGCPSSTSVPRRVVIPFGPGSGTDVTVVMNPGGNAATNTLWEYTVSSVNNLNSYLVFTEDPNLTTTPIKFAAPPLTALPSGPVVPISDFEPPPAGDYVTPAVVDGWSVLTTNPVTVITGGPPVTVGAQSLALRAGQLLRTVATTPGSTYRLNYENRQDGAPGALGAMVFVTGQVTNTFLSTTNWQPGGLIFNATAASTTIGLAPVNTNAESGVLVDSFTLTEASGPRYVLPEESLSVLRGENALGDWTLELWDSRTGATNQVLLLGWEMQFVFQTNTAVTRLLQPGVPVTTTIPAGKIAYYLVDVPAPTRFATNILYNATPGPLGFYFNQAIKPAFGATNPPPFPDVVFAVSANNWIEVLSTTNTVPPTSAKADLQPGQRYYLAIENKNAFTVSYTVMVDFDLAGIPPFVTLTNGVPYCTLNPGPTIALDYYRYTVSSNAVRAQFEINNPSGDVTLLLRRGLPPTFSVFDYFSANVFTNDEVITAFDFSQPVPLTPGDWYLAVANISGGPVSYCVQASEWLVYGTNIVITNAVVSSNNFCLTWTSLPGLHYYVEGLTNLTSTNWVTASPTVTAVDYTTTNCIPLPSPFQFFRVRAGIVTSSYFPPPVIASIRQVYNGILLTWGGPTNTQYQVQWSPTLVPTAWTPFLIPPAVTSTTGLFQFLDDGSQTGGFQTTLYYRLLQLP